MKHPYRIPKQITPYLQYRADSYSRSPSIIEKTIGALATMDIERVDSLIDNDRFYNGICKTEFLERLDQLFAIFKRKGDERLCVFHGRLPLAPKVRGYRLVGYESGNYIDLLVVVDMGAVVDIRECAGLDTPVFCKGHRLTLSVENNPF